MNYKIYGPLLVLLAIGCSTSSQKKDFYQREKQIISCKPCKELNQSSYKKDLLPHQMHVISYLYETPDVHGALIYHQMGSGKTLTALAFSELYQEKSILIISYRFLEQHWEDEIMEYGVKNPKRYKFLPFNQIRNKLRDKDLSNTIVIIDEIHKFVEMIQTSKTITQTKQFGIIFEKLQQSQRLLALTATPIRHEKTDLSYILNLVAGKNIITNNNEQFRKKYTKIKSPRSFFRGHLTESQLLSFGGVPALSHLAQGHITTSYIGLGVATVLGFSLAFINHIIYPLNKYSLREINLEPLREGIEKYISYYTYEKGKKSLDFPRKKIKEASIIYSDKQHELFFNYMSNDLTYKEIKYFVEKDMISKEMYDLNSDNLIQLIKKDKKRGLIIGNLGFFKDGLYIYPPKFLEIEKTLSSPTKKTVIYSNYRTSGAFLFRDFLEERGFKGQYGLLTQKQNSKERKSIITDYNTDKIKILILDPDMYEGLNLKGTAQMHILEPVETQAKRDQIIARAVRFDSHSHLPKNERLINVYIWKAILSDSKTIVEGNFTTPLGSEARHKDWEKRFSELNYYSDLGQGRSQLDKNYFDKTLSPDEKLALEANLLYESLLSLNNFLSHHSIEKRTKLL